MFINLGGGGMSRDLDYFCPPRLIGKYEDL